MKRIFFQVDESAKVADLQWDTLPGAFGIWGGSINQPQNGNVEFDLNDPDSTNSSQVEEVTQTATPQVVWQINFGTPSTASRVPSLYPGVTWSY